MPAKAGVHAFLAMAAPTPIPSEQNFLADFLKKRPLSF
jgi:hypothetical protein